MLRFLAAVAVVLAVLTAGALIVGAAVSRAAPLAARLEAWWARRSVPIGAAGRPDGNAAGNAGGNVPLAAMQGDDLTNDGGDGGGGGFGDGGFSDGGATGGGDGGGG